jgi:hypothetical protein
MSIELHENKVTYILVGNAEYNTIIEKDDLSFMVAGSEEGKITEEQLDWMNKSEKYILVTTKVTNMEYLFHSLMGIYHTGILAMLKIWDLCFVDLNLMEIYHTGMLVMLKI